MDNVAIFLPDVHVASTAMTEPQRRYWAHRFFNFLKSILENVAVFGETTEDRSELRALGLQVAYKAAFDILARCFYNQGIKDIT